MNNAEYTRVNKGMIIVRKTERNATRYLAKRCRLSINKNSFFIGAENVLDDVCVLLRSNLQFFFFFSLLVTTRRVLLFSVFFPFIRSARLLGYFHNDTLCNVNYCRRNELEEVFQDAASPRFLPFLPFHSSPLAFLPSYYILLRRGRIPFSLPLVNSARVSKGAFLVISAGRILRESLHCITAYFHGADLVKRLVRARAPRPLATC